jgi:hypothetical protein
MRNSIAAHLGLSAVMLLGSEGPASAGAVVDLEWISTSNTSAAATAGIGTDTLQAAAGDIVGLRMILSAGTEGITAWGISIRFDPDGGDELDISGVPEEFGLHPTVTCTPFPFCFFNTPGRYFTPGLEGFQESSNGSTGFAFSFEGEDTAGAGGPLIHTFGPFRIGEIVFEVTSNVASDGVDLDTGFFNPGYDGMFSDAAEHVLVNFGVASLDRVPDCQDRTDNDGDGEIDAVDPGCDDVADDSENSDALSCDDGVDNDMDTRIDFPGDTGCLSLTHPTEVGDEDGDGVADDADNCSLVANPPQVDSDGDFCGDFCDSDYNNDGAAGIPDFNLFRLAFATHPGDPGYNPNVDQNSDGIVGIPDHNLFRLGVGRAAGPSGTTAGTFACP